MRTREEHIKPWGYISPFATATLRDRARCDLTITRKQTHNITMPLYTEEQLREAERRAEQRVRSAIGRDRIALPTYDAFCNSAKGLMSGEFRVLVQQQCFECNGSGIEEKEIDDGTDLLCAICCGEGEITTEHLIPWTEIKKIYRAIVDEYAPKEAIDAVREVW